MILKQLLHLLPTTSIVMYWNNTWEFMTLDIRDPGLSLVDKPFRAKTKPCRSNFSWSWLIWYKTSRVNLEFETWGKLTNKISRFLKWSPIYNYLLNSVTSKTNLFRLRKTKFPQYGVGENLRVARFVAQTLSQKFVQGWLPENGALRV